VAGALLVWINEKDLVGCGLADGPIQPSTFSSFCPFQLFFSLSLLNSAIHTCKIVLQSKNV
jgi:hypothetical protein